MPDPKVNVTVDDLRLLLMRVEDWAHEVRGALEALPGNKKLAAVKQSELAAWQAGARFSASKGNNELARRVMFSEKTYKCAGSVPLVGPWPQVTDWCLAPLRTATSVLAGDMAKALDGIEDLVGCCRLYVSKIGPDTVIRPKIR